MHLRQVQDIEFTVQESKLWMLQCRTGKRTGACAVKIAVDMVNEGLVDTRTAIKMVEPQHLDQLLHPQVYKSTNDSFFEVPIILSDELLHCFVRCFLFHFHKDPFFFFFWVGGSVL